MPKELAPADVPILKKLRSGSDENTKKTAENDLKWSFLGMNPQKL
jgi:hypothetical protein